MTANARDQIPKAIDLWQESTTSGEYTLDYELEYCPQDVLLEKYSRHKKTMEVFCAATAIGVMIHGQPALTNSLLTHFNYISVTLQKFKSLGWDLQLGRTFSM